MSDIYFGDDIPSAGLGCTLCLYFSIGYCKNGISFRFLHGGGPWEGKNNLLKQREEFIEEVRTMLEYTNKTT